jgi:hypothetical protein
VPPWLDPVRAALDGRSAAVTFFIRDDDAGWTNDRLFRLLDLARWHRLPIDVAAIPVATKASLAAELRRAAEESGGSVAVHQHGYSHVNHEATGRKCEFGESRSVERQRRDIVDGRRRLEDVLGTPLASIFTPPWNRCTVRTAAVLAELGYRLLSCDVSAPAFGVEGLGELPVRLDWSGRHGIRNGAAAWSTTIADAITAAAEPVGLMLHHAVMTTEDRRLLSELLTVIAAHPMARVRSMLDCHSDWRNPRSCGAV